MVSVQSPPGGREVPYARALLLPAILMAAATGAAVAAVPEPARMAVGWCGGIAALMVLAVAIEAVRRGRTVKRLHRQYTDRLAYLERRVAVYDAQTEHLGEQLLPDTLYRMRQGESPAEAMRVVIDQDPDYRDLPQAQRKLLRAVLEILDRGDAMRDASANAFVHIARRVQAIVHQQSVELREMEEDHGRAPEVFDDLLRLDHGTALIGRLADSVAVLGGSRPGRQWPKPVPLYSVLRGAMSRILDYHRIDLDSIAKVSVEGISVEPVIHACAELLDNATRYSPPQTRVHVTAVEVQTGIAVEIEDGGVSLTEDGRKRAETMLAEAQEGVDLNSLSDTPRLGLAVVGRLCAMYGMQVSLRQSAYGGVRAVLIVPRNMLTGAPAPALAHGIGASAVPRVDNDGNPIQELERAPKKRRPTSGPPTPLSALEDDIPVVTEWTATGLPQRRSRVKTPLSERYAEARAAKEREAEAARAAEAKATIPGQRQAPAPREPEKEEPAPGLWVEAFMNGLKGGGDQQGTPGAIESKARADDDTTEDEGDLK
ncbi:ATP-binding protein [Streptomyces himalayensis]|uniref:histidine kinase n=1 Tax=Streptomyces himalayensis subsp. himalayensis TaxID=2756131 RepID=A0A7W0I8U1_9ACTN|nr:ATP-binding protein [Streptomyces himalayensis]MBA2946401.1 ATP-binding protein [Streptomyces himalayensis subsp. himalayensis]